jgi:hypothetical protein
MMPCLVAPCRQGPQTRPCEGEFATAALHQLRPSYRASPYSLSRSGVFVSSRQRGCCMRRLVKELKWIEESDELHKFSLEIPEHNLKEWTVRMPSASFLGVGLAHCGCGHPCSQVDHMHWTMCFDCQMCHDVFLFITLLHI